MINKFGPHLIDNYERYIADGRVNSFLDKNELEMKGSFVPEADGSIARHKVTTLNSQNTPNFIPKPPSVMRHLDAFANPMITNPQTQ